MDCRLYSCGYKLANDGIDTRAIQDWLGHVSITHTRAATTHINDGDGSPGVLAGAA
jgi:integrase